MTDLGSTRTEAVLGCKTKYDLKIRDLRSFDSGMLHYCVFSSEKAKNHALKIGGGFVPLAKVLIYLRVAKCWV